MRKDKKDKIEESRKQLLLDDDSILSEYQNEQGKHLPVAFKTSRIFDMYRGIAEREVYGAITDISEEIKKELDESDTPEEETTKSIGGHLICPSDAEFEGVTEVIIKKTQFALLSWIYKTSYRYGHEKTNTGLVDENGMLPNGNGVGYVLYEGKKYYRPVILVTLQDLAKDVFNVAKTNKANKTALWNTLRLMERKQLTDEYLKSDKLITVTTTPKVSGMKGNSTYLQIEFHPIYALQSFSNYGELPWDILKRINCYAKRATAPLYELLRLLNIQKKGNEFRIYQDGLLQETGRWQRATVARGEAVRGLDKDLHVMEQIGKIEGFKKVKRVDGILYVIKISTDFCKTSPIDELPKKKVTKRVKKDA